MFILNKIWAQDKIYILVGTLLDLNMNVALFYNLNFTVYQLRKICYSLAELYVKTFI
jgi:hypothetical protein